MRITRPLLRLLLVFLVSLCVASCGGGSGTATATRTISYAALGASDAVGIGAVPFGNGYVYLLEDGLAGLPADVTLENTGISGAHVDEIVQDALPRALAAAPDVVTVWTGANDLVGGDAPDAFAADLATLLEALQSGTNALVFVGDLPDLTIAPVFRSDPDKDVTPERVAAFNQRIHDAVAAAGCVLVRLSDVTFDDSMFFLDGFHPNNEGYARLAAAYWAEMEPRLRNP